MKTHEAPAIGRNERTFNGESVMKAISINTARVIGKHSEAQRLAILAIDEESRYNVTAAQKVALLLPTKWIQGDKRSRWLEDTPLRRVWFLAPRPPMPPGTVIAAGEKPGNGTTDYAWFIWEKDYSGRPEIAWLRRQAGIQRVPHECN